MALDYADFGGSVRAPKCQQHVADAVIASRRPRRGASVLDPRRPRQDRLHQYPPRCKFRIETDLDAPAQRRPVRVHRGPEITQLAAARSDKSGMTRIGGSSLQRASQHPSQPDAAGVDHAANADKAAQAKKTSPAPHMSKTERAAVDGLVKRQTPKSRLETVRAALAENPGLADHYVAERLRGHNSIEHQIVHAVLARSGTTGIQRLAMCESAVRQIQGLGRSRQADVLALVKTGSSVHAAVALVRDAVADIKAEAAAKSQQSMAHKLDASVKSLKHEAAQWKKTSDEMYALFRDVPGKGREAEVVTGSINFTAARGDVTYGAVASLVTGNGSHLAEAAAKFQRSVTYLSGKHDSNIDKADKLYARFSAQHIAYVKQNKRMQRAIRSGDFKTQSDARARMDALAADMQHTAAAFRPVAKQAARAGREFVKDTRRAVEHVAITAATEGLDELPGGGVVENVAERVGERVVKGSGELASEIAGDVYDDVLKHAVGEAFHSGGSPDSD